MCVSDLCQFRPLPRCGLRFGHLLSLLLLCLSACIRSFLRGPGSADAFHGLQRLPIIGRRGALRANPLPRVRSSFPFVLWRGAAYCSYYAANFFQGH